MPADNRLPDFITYRDFNLYLDGYRAESGEFRVLVEGPTPGGAMRSDEAATCKFDPSLFWKDPTMGSGGPVGRLDRRNLSREDLFKLGGLLADMALPPGRVRELYKLSLAKLGAVEGLRIRLHIEAAPLAQLPWEYMCLPQAGGEPRADDFLALQRELSIVRTDTVESIPHTSAPQDHARVVAVFSHPGDQPPLDLERDRAAISSAIKSLNDAAGAGLFELVPVEKPASSTALIRAAGTHADILHYSGHATFEAEGEGKLVLERDEDESEYYSAEQLATLLRRAGVRIVILSACETGRRNGQAVWSGVAPALTRALIPAIVANQFSINDESAALLTTTVFPRLLAGYAIDQAVAEARQIIYQKKGLEYRDWGVPVLYSRDETGVLFPLPPAHEGAGAVSPFLQVALRLGSVSGKVVGLEAGEMTRGSANVNITADTVNGTGSVTGIKLDRIG